MSADPFSTPPSEPKTSGLAIASLVLGILGLLTVCVGIGVPLVLMGLVLGIVGLVKIGKPGQPERGTGLAVAGVTTNGVGLLLSLTALPLMIGIMLPALDAARTTAHQMQTNTNARLIHQAVVTEAQNHPADANGNRPQSHDLGDLLLGGYITVEMTQTPLDEVGVEVPVDFSTLPPDEQADWVRQHSDFVLVPGLTDDLDTSKIAVFGKPDRFSGGLTVTRNDNSTYWESGFNLPQIEQDLQAQTGKTMAELIADAEAIAGP
ncbi:MAG: DUF4190 domain-containing protein [Planctomycetota bacterium]